MNRTVFFPGLVIFFSAAAAVVGGGATSSGAVATSSGAVLIDSEVKQAAPSKTTAEANGTAGEIEAFLTTLRICSSRLFFIVSIIYLLILFLFKVSTIYISKVDDNPKSFLISQNILS